MRTIPDTENVLGFCHECFRVRWLKVMRSEGDVGFKPEFPEGTCRSCERLNQDEEERWTSPSSST